jgi:hypothetical protein
MTATTDVAIATYRGDVAATNRTTTRKAIAADAVTRSSYRHDPKNDLK